MNKYMKHHIGNLSRLAGRDVSNKYIFVASPDDLAKSFYQSKSDLPYALRKEVKRDRFIYNSKGIKEMVNNICAESLNDAMNEMEKLIVEDAVNQIENSINNMIQYATGEVKIPKKSSTKNNKSIFLDAIAKGLVKGVGKIVDDIIDYD